MRDCPGADLLHRLDRVRGPERITLLEHARTCRVCRAVVARDPSRLFGLLALHSLPPSALDGLTATRIEVRATARTGFTRVVAWAVASVLAAVLAARLTSPLQVDRAGLARSAPVAEPVTTGAVVEILSTPGSAQLVEMTVGEAQLVMIFDEGFEL